MNIIFEGTAALAPVLERLKQESPLLRAMRTERHVSMPAKNKFSARDRVEKFRDSLGGSTLYLHSALVELTKYPYLIEQLEGKFLDSAVVYIQTYARPVTEDQDVQSVRMNKAWNDVAIALYRLTPGVHLCRKHPSDVQGFYEGAKYVLSNSKTANEMCTWAFPSAHIGSMYYSYEAYVKLLPFFDLPWMDLSWATTENVITAGLENGVLPLLCENVHSIYARTGNTHWYILINTLYVTVSADTLGLYKELAVDFHKVRKQYEWLFLRLRETYPNLEVGHIVYKLNALYSSDDDYHKYLEIMDRHQANFNAPSPNRGRSRLRHVNADGYQG